MEGPSFSMGDERDIDVREEDSLMLLLTAMEETLSILGYWDSSLSCRMVPLGFSTSILVVQPIFFSKHLRIKAW